ncbi:MAG: ABC transporter permease [Betaproteobacteria bacterium RIFCSPLOWO2_02_FULL_65_24]|nr:MAG: ABC transporter permease [Betaproteobacteria bacterium RIFCSPLOWO2_02_FULL_65_24]OGA30860.1 MAG: ABC transporter permease [Betaproteobacteria bacterium RIFCSPLOWO2_12_FULL_62_13b]
MTSPAHSGGYLSDPRVRLIEWLPWLAALICYFVAPTYLPLGSYILIMILFALSLDLILGYAGIITLGHAAYFGFGAYVAAIVALRVTADPLAGLAAAAFAAGLLGWLTGLVILRTRGLTLLMLTLAITSICFEIANKAGAWTGGADGLGGFTVKPILGLFRFDLFNKTAYLYSLVFLFLGWWLVRRIIYSPFGASLTGIRENVVRMQAVGSPVYHRLVLVYTISAALAGLAGALLTHTTQFVGLKVLSFEFSGDLLVMLILGGVGRIYGAFVGPLVYLVAQDSLAKQFPEYWYFGIGLMLILVVMFARGGILGILDTLVSKLPHARR